MAVTRTKPINLLCLFQTNFLILLEYNVKLLEFDMAPIKISIPQSRIAAKYNMAAS